jgi:hypothetical protein
MDTADLSELIAGDNERLHLQVSQHLGAPSLLYSALRTAWYRRLKAECLIAVGEGKMS